MDEIELVSTNLKKYIKWSGKSVTQIAAEAKIGRATLYEYIEGKTVPTVFALKKLCGILECTYEDILGKPE